MPKLIKKAKLAICRLYYQSILFKSAWYRNYNQDVDFSEISALKHYKKYGWKQGRPPSPFFNEEKYQSIAPDYQNGTRNPIEDAIDRLESGSIKKGDLKKLLRGAPREESGSGFLKNGISISGYLKSEVGVGQAARNIVAAVDFALISSSLHDLPLKGRDSDTRYADRVQESRDRKNNLVVIAIHEIPSQKYELRSDVKSILYPFWELSKIPANLRTYIDQYDEIWAPSQFIASMFSGYDKKVILVRQAVIVPQVVTHKNSNDRLKFLTYYDFDSFITRKNIKAPILAFQKAFPAQRDVSLTVKARGKDDKGAREWLQEKAAGDSRIKIIDKTVTRADVDRLIMECDAFISLHRSEGFGFGAAEALAAGKAVVSTDYSGTTDFITQDTGYPISYDIISVKEGEYPYWQDQVWADPHLESAVEALRRIYHHRDEAVQKGLAGRNLMIEQYSPAVIGKLIKRLISN
jgi:glycosyltransferase involved in cell wall biosynthesis